MAPGSRLVHEFGEPVEERPLAFEKLCIGRWQVEPFGAVDLGKTLHPSTFWRPFDFEGVASYGLDVDIAFDGERDHPLAATLANFAERIKRSRESDAGFLHELAARSGFGVLAFIHLALGNRPCPFVLLAPVWTARMHQEHL
jgi:hypothetical protein